MLIYCLSDATGSRRALLISIPLFLLSVGASAAAIFNYQKSSSSVVSSTLYSLRVNSEARALLGDEIQFASKWPWISGELNQFGGNIDISYRVKGLKGEGTLHFVSTRKERRGYVSVSCSARCASNVRLDIVNSDNSHTVQNGNLGVDLG